MNGEWCRPAWCYTLHFLQRGDGGKLISPALCGKQAAHRAIIGWYTAVGDRQRRCPKCIALGAPA